MSFPPEGELNKFSVNNASYPAIPFTVQFEERDPTFKDVNYPMQKIWLNKTTDSFWFLKNFYLLSTNYFAANWIPFGTGSGILESLTGDDNLSVDPVSDNINIFGHAVPNATHAKPIFFKHGIPPNGEIDLDVQVSVAAATSNINNAGIASFSSAQFSVDGNGYVTLAGGAPPVPPILRFQVDAFTSPGTNPVIADATGKVTITGGQVAAGTTANVIRTDSLAANTYTVEVQRSQAVATSTVGDNGVSHFNSANFTVDTNGFVSANPFAFNYTNVVGPITYNVLTTDYYISCDPTAGAITLNFPNSPTFKQLWIVKDRTGTASVNNISITTPGVTVTFDGLTAYVMNSNYQAINLLANVTPTYEVY